MQTTRKVGFKTSEVFHWFIWRSPAGCSWARSNVATLSRCREAMWTAVKSMGGVKGDGAFYFLVPVPVEEDIAIDVLAREWDVLVTPGR